MDYEVLYKDALERAEEIIKYYKEHNRGDEASIEDLETIFPELAESEDEKIRKGIIKYLYFIKDKDGSYMPNNIPFDDMIAWLEKQGEPRQHLELKAGNWYICHRAYCCRADHLTVKEGERFQCEKDGIVKGFVVKVLITSMGKKILIKILIGSKSNGWKFRGCFYPPNKGKFVANIKECPLKHRKEK
jgi:hypothetical protein